MRSPWPAGFERIPDEEWTRSPIESLATKYDSVENHGWYANLDPTVEEIRGFLREDALLVDYSGGTGILIDRLLKAMPDRAFGVVNVDSSPKFLRLSLEKQRDDPRVAFRLLRYLKDEKRLQLVTEVLGPALAERRVDAIASTNAIHLYYDLHDTLASWRRILRPDGRAFVQSGNVRTQGVPSGSWIIDDTVESVQDAAAMIVAEDARFAAYRPALADAARLSRYADLRRKVFLPARPLDYYLHAFEGAGFRVERVEARPVRASTREWFEFLSVYHEAVLGWVGGVEKLDGRPPTAEAVRDRVELLRLALGRVLGGKTTFDAVWTYLTCAPA